MSAGDFFQNLQVNLPLIANSFVGNHPFYGDFPSEILLGVPYPLTNWLGLGLALIGFFVAIATRNLIILMLAGVIILVPSISQVWPHYWTSLSCFRQAFYVIPLFLFIGLGIHFLGQLRGVKWVAYIGCLGLTTFQAFHYISDIERFSAEIREVSCEFKQVTIDERKFLCSYHGERYIKEKEKGRKQFETRGYYFAPYPNGYQVFEKTLLPHKHYSILLAKKIRSAMQHAGSDPVLVYAPIYDFSISRSSHLYPLNYHQFFLALYLQEEGLPVNYIVPYARSLSWTESFAGFLLTRLATSQPSTSLRISRHVNYPYPIKDEKYDIEEVGMWEKLAKKLIPIFPENLVRSLIPEPQPFGQFRQVQSTSNIYLVTTELEREYFLEKFSSYTEVQL